MMTRARATAAGVVTMILVAAGCNSGNTEAPCHVQGKVSYNNSPVGGGFVYLHLPDGNKTSLPILADGSFSGDFKEGTYPVTVETESLNPEKKQDYRGQGSGGGLGKMYGGKSSGGPPSGAPKKGQQGSPAPDGAPPPGTYVKIPAKYVDKSTSGLSVTLKKGKNEFNIPLTD
jgi:hypothetical protein